MMFLAQLLLLLVMQASTQPSPLDVRDFGAIPDDGVDDAPAIQAAIDAAGPGQAIRLPVGVFEISRTLDPKSGRSLVGKTMLRWDGDRVVADSQTILKAPDGRFIFYFRGDGLQLRHLTMAGRAIFCDRPNNVMVRGLVIDNCWFDLNVAGERTNAIEFTTGLADSRVTNCVFNPLKGDNGIYGYNWSNLSIANNHFLNGNEGIHLIAHKDDSSGLLIEQNYFAGLRRMGVEIQGGGIGTIVQDNYYERPVMTARFAENNDTFAYSIIADRSKGTRVRRNTSIAPERPDRVGVRIVFELGGEDVVCEDNYSVDGNHVAILNTSRNGKIINNRFAGYREAASVYAGRAINATLRNNSAAVKLSWDTDRGKPGPNRRLAVPGGPP